MTDKVADDDDDYKVIPWIASSKSSNQKLSTTLALFEDLALDLLTKNNNFFGVCSILVKNLTNFDPQRRNSIMELTLM